MPMFQVEGGRSVAMGTLDPARAGSRPATSGMVAEHLDTLLGEHLLPLRIRQGDADEPYLLAVDAAGQPVVVEVVGVLDELAVVRALRHAGRAATLSTQDLAQAYHAGAEHFTAHLEAFRRTVPATSLLSTTVRGGARLLLVCSALAEGVDELVEFLLQPAWQVEVLQVGVTEGSDGSRVIDVAPLRRTPPPRRAMEPHGLRLVRSADVPGATRTPPAGLAVRLTPPHGTPRPPVRRMPSLVPPPFAHRVGRITTAPVPVTSGPVAVPVTAVPVPTAVPSADAGSTPVTSAPGGEPDGLVTGVPTADAHEVTADPGRPPAPDLPYAFTGVTPPPAGPDPRMAAVAGHVGAPAAFVWVRRRRGECFEVLLRADGMLELPDGSVLADPDTAAAVVSGAEGPVDGWRVWRLDLETGPSLGELLAQAEGPSQP